MKTKTAYLGDGAYAEHGPDPLYISIYAEREAEFLPGGGLHKTVRHWVALEPDGLQALVDFARTVGWKIK